MNTPLVSVIIPTCNRAELLRRAVDSVRAQDFADWECVIVDDGSTDQTPAVIAELCAADSRFRTKAMSKRSGNTLTRSAACDLARGKYLAILDDDDWWEPGKLAAQVAALQADAHKQWSYHAAQLVSPAGPGAIEHVRHGDDFLQRLVQYNWLRHSSMIFRRSAFEAIGGYDRRLPLASDWDLVLRLTLRFGQDAIHTLPDPLVNYWVHPNNISTNTAVRSRAERRVVRRLLLRDGMLWKKPGMAVRMVDRQLDREMHAAMSEERWVRAFMSALMSAAARPFRWWRWQRAGAFARSMFTHRRPTSLEVPAPTPAPAAAPLKPATTHMLLAGPVNDVTCPAPVASPAAMQTPAIH